MSLIKIRDLHVAYGAIEALSGVSLDVDEGEIVAVIGANGAGKSTLLRAISGELPKKKGTVEFDGEDITSLSTDKIVSKGIAQVPEGRQIFSGLSVADNLRVGAYCRAKDNSILEDMELMYQLFPILAERKNQKGGSLSGGEQQMLALARALMARPRVLLLDEPSMGIAPLVTREIFKTIRAISASGITIVLIEQDAKLALKVAHKAYVMDVGKIVMEGTAADLRNNPRIKEIYLGG